MTEISDSLQRIDAKLESIASMIAGDQRAKVKNALDIARTYAALHDDYLQKPAEARQAARNEIEGRYNDVGQVIDWITEQLAGVEDGVRGAAEREKDLEPLLKEIQSYEAQLGGAAWSMDPRFLGARLISRQRTHIVRVRRRRPLFPRIFVPN